MERRGRVLLTGAGGMLARELWPALEAAGHEVTPLSHAELDIVDAGAVRAALEAVRPAVLVNAAAENDVDGAERDPAPARRVNAAGAEGLARACRTHGVILVHYSTDYVFDGTAQRPYREDDPTGPCNEYGRTKLEGEQRVRAALPEGHLIIRSSWLYGLGGPSFPRAILDRAREHEELSVVEDQVGCPTWTADLARATAALLEVDARGTVHAAAPDHVSRHGWAEALCAEAARYREQKVLRIQRVRSSDRAGEAVRPRWSVLDCARLQRLTGGPLPSWRQRLTPFVRQLVKTTAALLLPLMLLLGAGAAGGCDSILPAPKPRPITIPPPPAAGVTTTTAAQPLGLYIAVDGNGFTVGSPMSTLVGANGELPTVPCKEPGCPTPDSYDHAELKRTLAKIKQEYPDEDGIVIYAQKDVSYEVIVLVLDAARGDGDQVLFPDVSLSTEPAR